MAWEQPVILSRDVCRAFSRALRQAGACDDWITVTVGALEQMHAELYGKPARADAVVSTSEFAFSSFVQLTTDGFASFMREDSLHGMSNDVAWWTCCEEEDCQSTAPMIGNLRRIHAAPVTMSPAEAELYSRLREDGMSMEDAARAAILLAK